MTELQLVDSLPFWKAAIWCFCPITVLVLIEFFSSDLPDDDDDFGGGMMIPAYQPVSAK
tara:strand:+ start:147 stop:323 length:177 start_codon:yes stop_codon:yes gene_type:complete